MEFSRTFLLAIAYKMENTRLETELAGRKQTPALHREQLMCSQRQALYSHYLEGRIAYYREEMQKNILVIRAEHSLGNAAVKVQLIFSLFCAYAYMIL